MIHGLTPEKGTCYMKADIFMILSLLVQKEGPSEDPMTLNGEE